MPRACLFVGMFLFLGHPMRAQLSWAHDLYDRTGSAWAPKGWTLGLGAAGLRPVPQDREYLWQSFSSESGALDTLALGLWSASGKTQPALFVGRWWRLEQIVLWDRVGLEFTGTRRGYSESYASWLPDSSIFEGQGAAWTTSLGLHGYRAITFTPDLYLEGMIGVGVDGLWGREWSVAGPDSLFGKAPPDATWRFAIEGGVAFGVRIWSGRFLRIALATDLLQFAPLADGRGSEMDLLRQAYRPWSLGVKWDLQQVKPPLACQTPPPDPFAEREKKGTQLFDPGMKPKKKRKKKKGNRPRWL